MLNECSQACDGLDHRMGGLKVLWHRMGPPGRQKRRVFTLKLGSSSQARGKKSWKPILAMLFCVRSICPKPVTWLIMVVLTRPNIVFFTIMLIPTIIECGCLVGFSRWGDRKNGQSLYVIFYQQLTPTVITANKIKCLIFSFLNFHEIQG